MFRGCVGVWWEVEAAAAEFALWLCTTVSWGVLLPLMSPLLLFWKFEGRRGVRMASGELSASPPELRSSREQYGGGGAPTT